MGRVKCAVRHNLNVYDFGETPAHVVVDNFLGMCVAAVIDIHVMYDPACRMLKRLVILIGDPRLRYLP